MFGRGNNFFSNDAKAGVRTETAARSQTVLPDNSGQRKISAANEHATGKGRPTPKRKEAERGRRRVAAAPVDRKEAFRRNRERQREARHAAMQALKAGDERHLPMRDRGPVRSYVRDLIDNRRSVGEFFLPFALVILLLTWVGSTQLKMLGSSLWLLLVMLMIVDSIAIVVRLRRALARQLPEQNHRGAVAYGLMRSMQIRRFRLPPPKVSPRFGRQSKPGRRSRIKQGGS